MVRIQETIQALRPDLLVAAGDITRFTHPEATLAQLSEMSLPVLAIRGNSDWSKVDTLIEQHPHIHSLHLKKVCVNGVGFVGINGTIPVPFRSRVSMKEKRSLDALESLLDGHSILVAHPPPLGTLDEVFGRFHTGSRGLFQLIARCQPAMFICGHIHERPGSAFIGQTIVVNCNMGRTGSGAIIDFEKGRSPEVRILKGTHTPTHGG